MQELQALDESALNRGKAQALESTGRFESLRQKLGSLERKPRRSILQPVLQELSK